MRDYDVEQADRLLTYRRGPRRTRRAQRGSSPTGRPSSPSPRLVRPGVGTGGGRPEAGASRAESVDGCLVLESGRVEKAPENGSMEVIRQVLVRLRVVEEALEDLRNLLREKGIDS